MSSFDTLFHMEIRQAEERLEREGRTWRTERTNPPKRPIDGEERVCRIRTEGDTVILTAATYIREI